MSESVYEKDGRRIVSAIDAMRARETREHSIYTWSRELVSVDLYRRELYSYGRHFPLFRYIPRDGRRRELFVVNGDEFGGRAGGWHSSRTPDHQASTRAAIAKCGADSLVIPFSALEGASIDIDSVRPIHVRPDANYHETREVSRLDLVTPAWRRTELETAGPDADGMYRWRVNVHRLGDCLFSAVRIGETARRRYLSSFDYEEPRPLYFLVQVPRGAGDTVETAIDSLAPRAVWAARARGLEVRRQGDIFFVETALTDETLSARGIRSRVRLTQLDRDARARIGETGYVAPLDAAARRRMGAWRRKDFLRQWRDAQLKLARGCAADETFDARQARRVERAREWSTMRARHELERAQTLGDDSAMGACDRCGAVIGAPCVDINNGLGRAPYHARRRLSEIHRDELEGFKRATRRREDYGRPVTSAGARGRWAELRARHARDVDAARAACRAAVFGRRGYGYRNSLDRYAPVQRYTGKSPLQHERRELASCAKESRRRLDDLESCGARDAREHRHNRQARDAYRSTFRAGPLALAAWRLAGAAASAKFYPDRYGAGADERRAKVRRALSIYGTAHTAREVVTVAGGAVYVRGMVSHRPALDSARASWDRAPDHRPLELDPSVWYLAIRNRVPRARA